MSSQTALTGTAGVLKVGSTRVARLTQWGVSPKLATSSEWGDSDGEGYTNRAAGRKDSTFTAEGKYDTVDEVWDLFEPGDIVAATLFLNSTLYYHFPRALCTEFSLVVNVDTEEVVGWTSQWGADGIFYRPSQSGAPTVTYPT